MGALAGRALAADPSMAEPARRMYGRAREVKPAFLATAMRLGDIAERDRRREGPAIGTAWSSPPIPTVSRPGRGSCA